MQSIWIFYNPCKKGLKCSLEHEATDDNVPGDEGSVNAFLGLTKNLMSEWPLNIMKL